MIETDVQEPWHEPVRGGYPDPRLLALNGLERMETFRKRISPPPPLHHLTGASPTNFGAGTAEATMPASGWLLNSAGVIGGGTLAIVADIAFGLAVQSEIGAATSYTTAELSLTFLRPAHAGANLVASGQAIHVGRSVGLSEVFMLTDDPERLLAHGTSRLSIQPPREDLPPVPDDLPVLEAPVFETPDPYLREPPAGVLQQSEWEKLDGLEVVRRQAAGTLLPPPICRLTGLRTVEAGEGAATMALPLSAWLTSPAGTVQGGVTAMLADAAMMSAALTTAPRGTSIAGLDLKVNYLRPVFADGTELVARAAVEHTGRTIVIVRAEVTNAEGKRVALATGSAMYLQGRPASLGEDELG